MPMPGMSSLPCGVRLPRRVCAEVDALDADAVTVTVAMDAGEPAVRFAAVAHGVDPGPVVDQVTAGTARLARRGLPGGLRS
jgi:hypothetical protein